MRRSTSVLLAAAAAVALAAALPASAAGLPSIPSTKFTVSQGCGCHAALLEQWSKTMHSKALSDPIYQVKLAEANRATDGVLGEFCEDCHGPVAGMAGMNGKGAKPRDAVAEEGVVCDFCHQLTGATRLANNAWTIQADGVKRAQFKDALSPSHGTAFSAFHTTSDICGACHNVDHPGNGLPLEATYTEWKNSPYAKNGTTCQDCHMTPGPGVTKPNPGRAAAMAPERPHIYSMTFVGGNVALGGDPDLAEAQLKYAADLAVDSPEVVEPGGKGAVKVTVTNVGAGHYLPTGLTEVRECWLQVTVTDAAGAEVLSERRDFHTVLQGADGKSPVELWEAVAVKEDTRIPPQQSKSFDFSYDMPASGPASLTAALYYRSCSEAMAKKAGVDVPTTEMAKFEQAVYASEADLSKADSGGDVKAPAEGSTPAIILVIGLVALGGVLGYFLLKGRLSKGK